MGHGYQGRISRILETCMQRKIADKTEMYRVLLSQLKSEGEARLTADIPESVIAGGKTLAENLAYNEGLLDGLAVLKRKSADDT
jgi:hypothetical protein